MNYSDIEPISYLKTNPSDVVKRVQESGEPIGITVNGRVQAVIQDPISFQKTRDQLTMLRILAIGQQQIAEGKLTDHDALFDRLEAEDNQG
ncbi:MAG: type II toxin-antitoxin system Phd/YefM family antitoxin [Duganella sp.]